MKIFQKVNLLIEEAKKLKTKARVPLDEAWKILQNALTEIVIEIQNELSEWAGESKKIIAMEALSNFYDNVIEKVDIPGVPNIIEPIVDKYIKKLLLLIASGSIDSMVATLKKIGVFKNKDEIVNGSIDSVSPTVHQINKDEV